MEEKGIASKNGGVTSGEEPGENIVKPKAELSLRMKWKDPILQEKFLYSLFMAAAFISLGMYIGQLGPTFLDIRIITDTDLESASAFFTGGNVGYLTGSVVAGFLYNKVNKPFLIFISTFLLGFTNIFVPHCTQFELMIFLRFLCGSFAGSLDTGGNSEHMRIWGSEADGLMQFMHFCFSLGGVVSPLYAEPFLAEKDTDKDKNTTSNESLHSNSSLATQPTETRIEYVFLITGVFIMTTSIPFLFIFVRNRNRSEPAVKVEKRKFSQRNVPFSLLILMLVSVCLFYFTYCCVEDTFFSFLMTFLVEEYDSVSKSKGALTTAIAWASFAASRFLMIFMTKLFTPVQLLAIMTTSMAVAFSSFTIFAYHGIIDALVVFSALAAFSQSGVFPAGFSLMESKMFKVTGIISSCILVSSSTGSIINPLILGYLMEGFSNMWFCYLILIQTFLLCLILIILLLFSSCYVDKKYGAMGTSTQEIQQPYSDDCNGRIDDMEVEVEFLQ